MPAYLQEFDNANANVGAGRNPLNTEVIQYVDDLSAASLAWRTDDVQNMAKVSTVTAGSITLGVAVGPRQFIADQLLAKADVIRAMRERVQLCRDPQNLLSSVRALASVASTECTTTQPFRNSELKSTRLDNDLSRGSRFRERQHGTHTQRRPVWNRVQKSARHRGSSTPGCTHSQAAHPRNDTRRSLGWFSAATTPGNSHQCGHCYSHLDTLDDQDRTTAKSKIQTVDQAAEEARQQTIGGLQGLTVTNPTV